jgi:hypothetical protein
MTDRDLVLSDIAKLYGDILPKHAQEVLADFSRVEGDELVHFDGGPMIVWLYDDEHPVAEAYWNAVETTLGVAH